MVLASASPARLATLRAAGLDPEVVVSGVDEAVVLTDSPAALARRLAELKASAVVERIGRPADGTTLVVGCDSVLELDGIAYGKPGDVHTARNRWRAMRGRSGVLHTGHCVAVVELHQVHSTSRTASTIVTFADVSDAELEAYLATGEPLAVAGGFTVDGLGGAFVESVDGDPHNVVGISLPLLRRMLAARGVRWADLWRPDVRGGAV